MTQAATTSPFALRHETENPWIVWERCATLSVLNERNTNEDVSLQPEAVSTFPEPNLKTANAHTPTISRMQYNAVLSRMNQAKGKTGSYAAWKPL